MSIKPKALFGAFAIGFVVPATIAALVDPQFGPVIRTAVAHAAQRGRVAVVNSAKAAAKLAKRIPTPVKKVKVRAAKTEIAFFVSLTAMRQLHKVKIAGKPIIPDPDKPFEIAKAAVPKVKEWWLEAYAPMPWLPLAAVASLVVITTAAGFGGGLPLAGVALEIALA